MSYQAPPPPGPGQGYGPPQDHPRAKVALILGILSYVCCGIFTAIPAYIIGNKAVKEIDASGGQMGGRGLAVAGKILGLVAIILFVIGIIIYIILFATGALSLDQMQQQPQY